MSVMASNNCIENNKEFVLNVNLVTASLVANHFCQLILDGIPSINGYFEIFSNSLPRR